MSIELTPQRPMFLSRERWESLWQQLGGIAPDGSFDHLCARYAEPHRYYHNAGHILATLEHFDRLKGLAESPALVEYALWMHDAIYDTRSASNEAQSAHLAEHFLLSAGFDNLAPAVVKFIMATTHTAPSEADDAGLVVDIDLSVLALPAVDYEAYAGSVRKEYHWVPEPEFRAGRRRVLESLLAMPTLYVHPANIAAWESRARTNLESEFARVSSTD